jgi:outer membrane protein OmpA-like peptidoglycan-associated protein/tetratricopeptide (TPR) repeat protein
MYTYLSNSMKTYIFWLLFIIVLLGNLVTKAQNATLKEADTLFSHQQYATALPIYTKLFKKDSTNKPVTLKIARIYNFSKEYKIAETWYAKVGNAILSKEPDRMFEYAEILRINGKYVQAAEAYRSYYVKVPNQPRAIILAKYADSIAKVRAVKTTGTGKSTIDTLTGPNTKYADFSPWVFKDQLLYLTDRVTEIAKPLKKTTTKGIYVRTGKGYSFPIIDALDAHQLKIQDSVAKKPASKLIPTDTSFLAILRKELNVGPICFNKKEDTLFFSRVKSLKDYKDANGEKLKDTKKTVSYDELCYLVKNGDKWSEIKTFPYNDFLKYSMMHPALTNDGKRLYFASDRSGNLGKFDIFYCERLTDSVWSVPVNAGSAVNTVGSELFPYIDDQNTLFFASDGHLGLGGLDLFSTPLSQDPESANWKIFHLPEPINSSADDFGVHIFAPSTATQKSGFLSSNRAGSKGLDDVYSFKLDISVIKPSPLDIMIIDRVTQLPMANVTLTFTRSVKDSVITKMSDASGMVHLVFNDNRAGLVTLVKEKYLTKSDSVSIHREGSVVVFEMEQQRDFIVKGRVIDKQTGLPIESSTVLIDGNNGNLKNLLTDSNGRYEAGLERSTSYFMLAKKEGYFSKRTELLSTQFRNETATLYIDFELEKVVVDLEKKIENIYYDYAQATLRESSLIELDKLRNILVDNPNFQVELSAHTDSRGNDEYNMALSQKRASAVVNYLIQKGVSPGQIMPKGYGESKPINKCTNGAICTEEQYEMNRRTEFKVIGYIKYLPTKTVKKQKVTPKKKTAKK